MALELSGLPLLYSCYSLMHRVIFQLQYYPGLSMTFSQALLSRLPMNYFSHGVLVPLQVLPGKGRTDALWSYISQPITLLPLTLYLSLGEGVEQAGDPPASKFSSLPLLFIPQFQMPSSN